MEGSKMWRKPSTWKKSFCAPGQSREALADTSAPVLNTHAVQFVGGRARAGGGAVVGVAAAHARGHVEPAEEGLRQQQLVVGVRPGRLVIQPHGRGHWSSAKVGR